MLSRRSSLAIALSTLVTATALFATPHTVRAQGADTAKVTLPDSNARPRRVAPVVERAPISPSRAFFYSAAIPGLGQAKLDRPNYGAFFFLLEVTAVAMANRTAADVRAARAFKADSVPSSYKVDASTGAVQLSSTGLPVVDTWKVSSYPTALVEARRLQYEDWMAIIIFNHLFSGADAFVAAQLWDLPQRVKFRAVPLRSGATSYGFKLSFR